MVARDVGAAALAIINTEDKLESVASGVGIVKNITEAMVLTVKDLPVVCSYSGVLVKSLYA